MSLLRAADGVMERLRETEIRSIFRKQYLFLGEQRSSDEDVVQFHEYSAMAGDAIAQVTMGDYYLTGGHGLPQSLDKAFEFYSMAASQEDARGESMLAFMYEKGYGVAVSNSSALKMYEDASLEEDLFAMCRLGLAHLEGRLGLEPSLENAQTHFAKASQLGAACGFGGLGRVSARRKDSKQALKFFALAVQKGHRRSALALARLQLAESAVSCATAIRNLAVVVESAEPVVQQLKRAHGEATAAKGNKTLALELYEQLAWAGVEEAQANAAHLLHHEFENLPRAVRYYQLSAEQHNSHSHLMIGDLHYNGLNLNLSLTAYRRAADLRHHEAMYNLGYMYQHGEGVPQPDPHLAKRFYDLALTTNPASMYAVYLSLAHLMLTTTTAGSLIESLDLKFLWNDTLILSLLCVLLMTLIAARAR